MADTVREPVQERSILKKKQIIEAGYALFAEKGYFATNTAEIAKRAGVSTGIVYGYFRDKRDILLDALDIYLEKAVSPIDEMFDKLISPIDFEQIIAHILDNTVIFHLQNSGMHEILHSLRPTDEVVCTKFIALEDNLTKNITEGLRKADYHNSNIEERVHLAISMVQSFAHEMVFDKHDYLDYDILRTFVQKSLLALFTSEK